MTPLYRSRQISWFLLVFMAAMIVFIAIMNRSEPADPAPWWIFPAMAAIPLAFSTMTVTVTREEIRVRFPLGVPRRTIPIARIRACEPFEARGLARWRVGVKPLEGRYVMRGGRGVVLTLDRGIPLTISAPDPERLAKAVAKARERHEHLKGA